MGVLKVTGSDLGAGNMRRDRHHWYAASMAIKEPIDQVQVAGATASGADSEFARHLRLCAGGKRRDFFVPDGNPLDLAAHAQRFGDAVERIAHQSINSPHV